MPGPGIDVSTEGTPSHLVARLAGELDLATAPVARAALDDALRAVGDRHLVVDLTGLTFLGSPGLGLLVNAWGRCAGGGAAFTVVAPPGSAPHRVLEITGLIGSITVVDGVREVVGTDLGPEVPDAPGR
ncbi:STAS domain-containing protein [Actinokineospora sp. PR83]|uniref:STAS domain-containing protein n=1 Tax=Actinokineospora sp. PR83 TaxID=2884908 RepID=UPI001F21C905|nr:STAS domain-containing protein [Actinokineospora sp. PR83]MCG8916430.1 STAS domain-containing protein [Actinokineospora sp. PR83]